MNYLDCDTYTMTTEERTEFASKVQVGDNFFHNGVPVCVHMVGPEDTNPRAVIVGYTSCGDEVYRLVFPAYTWYITDAVQLSYSPSDAAFHYIDTLMRHVRSQLT